ncbi:hypothetical protein BC833DRAFT_309672, partial [Globomyces pollinis-pini]
MYFKEINIQSDFNGSIKSSIQVKDTNETLDLNGQEEIVLLSWQMTLQKAGHEASFNLIFNGRYFNGVRIDQPILSQDNPTSISSIVILSDPRNFIDKSLLSHDIILVLDVASKLTLSSSLANLAKFETLFAESAQNLYTQYSLDTNNAFWDSYMKDYQLPSLFNQKPTGISHPLFKLHIETKWNQVDIQNGSFELLVQAAMLITIKTFTGQDDVAFATFCKSLHLNYPVPLRLEYSSKWTVAELLEYLRKDNDIKQQVMPIGTLSDLQSILEHLPVLLIYNSTAPDSTIWDTYNDWLICFEVSPLFSKSDTRNQLQVSIHYQSNKFTALECNQIGQYFDSVLKTLTECIISNNSNKRLNEYDFTPLQERELLIQFGTGPVKEIPFTCAHHAFEKMGLQVGEFVGVLTTRSIEMVIGFLAVL